MFVALLHLFPVWYVCTSCLLSLLNMSEDDFNKTHEHPSIGPSCVCVCVSQLLLKPDELTRPSTSSSHILMRLEVTWGSGGVSEVTVKALCSCLTALIENRVCLWKRSQVSG